MKATLYRYNKNLLIHFEQTVNDGIVLIRNKDNEVVFKQKVKNKTFMMIELKEDVHNLFVEIIENSKKPHS